MFFKTQLRKLRYPLEDGKAIIELRVDELRQLFDERDPSPFRTKDLDDDAVEYIVVSTQEVSLARVKKIRIHCLENFGTDKVSLIQDAIHSYFMYQEELVAKKLNKSLNTGLKSLSIGLGFLALAIYSSMFATQIVQGFWGFFLREGFHLLGWVSMWKPINLFLYDWWPLLENKRVYGFLSQIDIDLVQVHS